MSAAVPPGPSDDPEGRLEPPDDPVVPARSAGPTDPVNPAGPPTSSTAARGGMRQVLGPDFDAYAAVGGVRGLVEATAPGVVFLAAYLLTDSLSTALVASLTVAGLATIVRLLQRTPITQAVGGLAGVGVGVFIAWRSGQAQDFYLWGLLVNGVYSLGLLAALAMRWPVVGVVVAVLRGEDMGWRTDPARRARRTAYTLATWIWVALFGLRLVVQVPLYLTEQVAALGVARLVMGVPLWALALWLTWLLVRAAPQPSPEPVAS